MSDLDEMLSACISTWCLKNPIPVTDINTILFLLYTFFFWYASFKFCVPGPLEKEQDSFSSLHCRKHSGVSSSQSRFGERQNSATVSLQFSSWAYTDGKWYPCFFMNEPISSSKLHPVHWGSRETKQITRDCFATKFPCKTLCDVISFPLL